MKILCLSIRVNSLKKVKSYKNKKVLFAKKI